MVYELGVHASLEPFTLDDVRVDGRYRPKPIRLCFFYVSARQATRADLDHQRRRRIFPYLEWEVLLQATVELTEAGRGSLWYFQGVFCNPVEAGDAISLLETTGRLSREAAECFRLLVAYGFEGHAYVDEDGYLRNTRVSPQAW